MKLQIDFQFPKYCLLHNLKYTPRKSLGKWKKVNQFEICVTFEFEHLYLIREAYLFLHNAVEVVF